MTSTSAPLLGAVLGDRYEIVRHLARGGTSDVYEARDLLLQRPVAAKVFRATAPTDRARFDAEITTLASLNHPTLVAVYDAGEHQGDGFVILELVDGPTLRSILAERGRLPEQEVADLGATLADALVHVHAVGVVHRDVTPSNVLCGPDGRPRLADFGIARLLDTSRVTALATAVGTAAYMAPEQLEGQDVGPAADVYALGLVLAEARSGRPAFTGAGHEVALARLVREPDLGADLPPGWAELLTAMTARDPMERPTADEVASRLRAMAVAPASAAVGVSVAQAQTPVDLEAVTTVVPATLGSGAASGAVDLDGATTALPAAGGTTVMPAILRPTDAAPAAARPASGGRGWAWAAGAAVVLGVLLLAGQAGDGIDVPATPTTSTPIDATEPVVTTTIPPPTTTEPPPPPEGGDGEGNGKGNGRKKSDDDD